MSIFLNYTKYMYKIRQIMDIKALYVHFFLNRPLLVWKSQCP